MSHVRIKVARKFVPHAMLLNAAARALKSAKAKKEAYWWDWLGTILYCSLSVEAIGNTYGETFISRWQDFESAAPARQDSTRCRALSPSARFFGYAVGHRS